MRLQLFPFNRRVKGAPSGEIILIGVGSIVVWFSGFGYCEDLEEKSDNRRKGSTLLLCPEKTKTQIEIADITCWHKIKSKMQQDRTFVPGVDSNSRNDLYSRKSPVGGGRMSGTFVPGMQEVAPGVVEQAKSNQLEVPVVGFLYSISRKGIGEYWPLHLGANTIGRGADCDVRLREMSVSSLHAKLNIKQMKTTGALIATIRDEGSRTGIYVNDEELDYDSHNCKNGDILLVGANYHLLLMLVNAKELGLSVSDNFVADNDDVEEEESITPTADPNATAASIYNRQRRYEGGTVDLSGASFDTGGDTHIL